MLTGKEESVSVDPHLSDHTHCSENTKRVVSALPVCKKTTEIGLIAQTSCGKFGFGHLNRL